MRLSRSSRIHAGLLAAAIAAIALLTASTARGDACTWTGATSTEWKTPGNWSGCTTAPNYPDTGDTVTVNSGGNQPEANQVEAEPARDRVEAPVGNLRRDQGPDRHQRGDPHGVGDPGLTHHFFLGLLGYSWKI